MQGILRQLLVSFQSCLFISFAFDCSQTLSGTRTIIYYAVRVNPKINIFDVFSPILINYRTVQKLIGGGEVHFKSVS